MSDYQKPAWDLTQFAKLARYTRPTDPKDWKSKDSVRVKIAN